MKQLDPNIKNFREKNLEFNTLKLNLLNNLVSRI